MTDASRSEITNSIWLCRNCHKLIDTDEKLYSPNILFAWREQHEEYILSALGNKTDSILLQERNNNVSIFENYPPLIRRIVIDKPDGWEWRLAAELMRYLNRPLFRRIDDLQDGLYVKKYNHVDSKEILEWLPKRLAEHSRLVEPLGGLFDKLNKSFVLPDQEDNEEEILHITKLIRDHLSIIIDYEEDIHFTIVDEEYEKLYNMLKNLIGSQAKKLAGIPKYLDEVVDLLDTEHGGTVENPHVVTNTITFELPKNWEKNFDRELRRLKMQYNLENDKGGTFSPMSAVISIIFTIILVISFC